MIAVPPERPIVKGMDKKLTVVADRRNSDAAAAANLTQAGIGHILSLYGNSGSEERRSSMQQLIDDSVQFLNTVRRGAHSPEIQSLLETSMVDVANRSYAILESCALELNSALGPSELWLSCTPPSHVNEALKFDRMRRPTETVTTFRGRVSSGLYSIVLRAQDGVVDFLLLPSDRAVGLMKSESNYSPLMTFTGNLRAKGVEWLVEDKPLTDARLEKYCIEFFRYFLEETRSLLLRPQLVPKSQADSAT